jgi:acetylornithine deacetylase/succinyl-diaminopimelate desuccinylase-like protein
VRQHVSRLATDYVLVWDGDLSQYGHPQLVTGMRGNLYVELRATGPASDLHSGIFGGNAPNPLNSLARILAELKGRDGRVTVPGFYEGIQRPDVEEMTDWDLTDGFGEMLRTLMGATVLEGEAGYSAAERAWSRPTLDVNGFTGGFTGEGRKTVIPSRASAKVSMRLVPGQDPMRILDAFTR